jgi:predicted XRE-type DNA-binding protein
MKNGQESIESYTGVDVFADLGFPPGESQALHVQSDLMIALIKFIARKKLTAAGAAKLLGLTPSRFADLRKGKLNEFSINQLVELLAKAGLRVDIRVSRAA